MVLPRKAKKKEFIKRKTISEFFLRKSSQTNEMSFTISALNFRSFMNTNLYILYLLSDFLLVLLLTLRL